jgi:hypothetical protein
MQTNQIAFALLLAVLPTTLASSQDSSKEAAILSIETKLLSTRHINYHAAAFDVAKLLGNRSSSGNRFYDPYGTLTSAYIFIAEALPDSNLNKPKGLIGVFRADSILWCSDPLTENLSTLGGLVAALGELNKDGKTEIVISQNELPGASTSNYLWIFTWDGKAGKLVTELDEHGESKVAVIGKYSIIDVDGDGIFEIRGEWYKDENFDKTLRVTYSWNGRLFGNWGKTSKYLKQSTTR